jgi:hypothetical protein
VNIYIKVICIKDFTKDKNRNDKSINIKKNEILWLNKFDVDMVGRDSLYLHEDREYIATAHAGNQCNFRDPVCFIDQGIFPLHFMEFSVFREKRIDSILQHF